MEKSDEREEIYLFSVPRMSSDSDIGFDNVGKSEDVIEYP